jgi:hypothetical protein
MFASMLPHSRLSLILPLELPNRERDLDFRFSISALNAFSHSQFEAVVFARTIDSRIYCIYSRLWG